MDTVTSLEAQAAEIQQHLAEEHKMQTICCAANEELLKDLRVKVEQLKTVEPQSKATEAKSEEAHAAFQQQVQDEFSPQWLEENGLHGMPAPAVQVPLAQFTSVLQAITPAQQAASLAPTTDAAASTLSARKRLAGEMDPRWSDAVQDDAELIKAS